jgi:hypothetical protein
MESRKDHTPAVPPTAAEAQLMEEVPAVLCDASCPLTEDGIWAVVLIRRYRATLSAIEDLILEGKIAAERCAGVSEDTLLTVDDYVFRALSDEEQAQLRTLKDGAPEELAS